MAELTKLYAVAVKSETTEGTDAVPTFSANAVRMAGANVAKLAYLEAGDRPTAQHGRLGQIDRVAPSGRYATIDITVELRGAGATYTASVLPDVDPLLQACGFGVPTIAGSAGSETATYTTVDAGYKTCTIYGQGYNKQVKLVGCVGTMKMAGEVNKIITMTFSMTGRVVTDPVESAFPAITLSAVKPIVYKGATTTIGSLNFAGGLRERKFAFDLANSIQPRPAAGATDGHDGYQIVDRNATLGLDLLVLPISSWDPFAASKAAGLAVSIAVGTGGTPTYDKCTLSVPDWEPDAPDMPDASGMGLYSIKGQCKLPAASREVSLIFA